MADNTADIALAKELIRANGRQVTLQKLDSEPDDVAKPWRGPAAVDLVLAESTIYVVALPPSSASSLGLSLLSDDLIKQSKQIFIAEVGEDAPEDLGSYHRAEEADGSLWRITFVEQLRPAEQTILYFIGVTQ